MTHARRLVNKEQVRGHRSSTRYERGSSNSNRKKWVPKGRVTWRLGAANQERPAWQQRIID